MWAKSHEQFHKRSLLATIILAIIVFTFSTFLVLYIRSYSRKQCYDKLRDATEQTIDSIEGEFTADRNQLKLVARIITNSDEDLHSSSVVKSLNTYKVHSVISDIAILTPDNTVIRVAGEDLDATGVLDYDEVHLRGEHISTLQKDLDVEGEYNLRNYVPIKQKGRTVAFLYTTFIPQDIIDTWIPDIYDGQALVTIVNRETGMIILDAGGHQLENIEDIDIDIDSINLQSHTFLSAIMTGRGGFATGTYGTTGEKFYFSFLPMHMEKWELIVSVPESLVYESIRPVNNALLCFLICETLALLIYIIYLIRTMTGSVEKIERRAALDALTGLQNRNRYEYLCQNFHNRSEGMACVYFDVNGLHEINNAKGHLAGDEMLKTIANIIQAEFGNSNTFRIGGDEFVAFRYENNEQAIRNDIEKVTTEIENSGYHVAVGMAMSENGKSITSVIKDAEQEMYKNKKEYYDKIGKEMR